MNEKPLLILISHTHWDREWYYTFEKFRYRLVKCIDNLLDILRKKQDFHSFMLDGQVAPLEDYLEVRPEKKEELKKFINEGKILIGPWYVQPDEFLVNEESLVRNLLYGRLKGREFGHIMKIGYLPDTFGHTAQLPQILRGFGIDTFVFHRGIGVEFEELGTPFIWKSPDGSEVIALFLYGGYCNLAQLPPDVKGAEEMIRGLYNRWKKYMRAPVIPGMVGCDHHLPKDYVPDVVKELSKADLPVEVMQGNLEDVANILRQSKEKLKSFKGELLSSHYHWVLYGTWSTRTYLKQLNFDCEILLLYYVEPLWTLAWLFGAEYPESEISTAWKYVLLSHPHDSICGCSVDEVHREVETRLIKARELCRELLYCTGRGDVLYWYLGGRAGYHYKWHALPLITSKIDLTFAGDGLYVVAFNTLPWRRKTLVRMKFKPYQITPLMLSEIARVASKNVAESALQLLKHGKTISVDFRNVILKDPAGNIIPCQVREFEDGSIKVTWIDELPPLGFKSYSVIKGEYKDHEEALKAGEHFIENDYLRVEFDIERGGALRILDKRTGEVYEGLAVLEDGGDIGDEYDYSPPEHDKIIRSDNIKASLELIEQGPVYLCAKVSYTMKIPKSASENRKSRSEEEIDIPVDLYVTLYRGIPRVDLRIVIDNRAEDHRLRIVFPTGVKTKKHYAKTHYMIIERPNESPHYYLHGTSKVPIKTYPTRSWVSINDDKRGLCIVAKGLHEYEIRENKNGAEIIFTLLRCVGWLSRGDLLTRPGHAGPYINTPDAQCLGIRSFELSIIPYSGSLYEAGVHKLALEYIVPGIAHEDISHKGELPPQYSLLEVEGDPILFSTFKRGIDGKSIILRIYNPSPHTTKARITLHKRPHRLLRARLDEEDITELEIKPTVEIPLKPYRIETIKILF